MEKLRKKTLIKFMIYTYQECIEMFGTYYAFSKALVAKKFFKIKEGVYANENKPKEIAIFVKEYHKAIFTMQSAFYYLNISDVVPKKYYVATDKDATKYKKDNIVQYFLNNGLDKIGVTTINYDGTKIKLFNKERMLIELIRYKNKLPFDYYKEIINYYREHIDEINIPLVVKYLNNFPKKSLIKKTIELEVL